MSGPAERLTVGGIEVVRLLDGVFRVDGGAMFGVVPRTLWAAKAAPDGENRVTLALNCYLVRTPGANVLLDTGIGPDAGRRIVDFYSFDRRPGLLAALAELGLGAEDIDVVVNSHLHFDHCGGNTAKRADGSWAPTFPRARYVVRRGEWERAHDPAGRDRPSYRPAALRPLAESGRLELIDGDAPVAPGVEAVLVAGHTAFHQGVKASSGGRTFFYAADAVPTAAHVGLDSITSFDLYPVETYEAKKALLDLAEAGDWALGFGHDPAVPFGRLRRSGRRLDVVPA
ncbi:MAG TPA: MBL fold metallo-hydrolase [Candidatus Aminicenantes bacterium]|nr:MBL fold metallo-hydrolase [Candidatus Aminicenantes bacterium]